MSYAFNKVSNTVIDLEIPTFSWATFTLTITKLTPNTYVYSSVIDVDIEALAGETFETTDNVYAISSADTYRITLNEDGVYKALVSTTGADTTGTYIFVIKDSLLTYIKESVNDTLSCNPETECHCNENCEKYYNFCMLALLSASFFADNVDINFNYGNVTSGELIKDYVYKCTNAGAGTRDFQAGSIPLLREEDSFSILAADTNLTLNETYVCIYTGTPDTWGSTVLTAMTDDFVERLKYIADTIDRIDDYQTNVCTCNCNASC